MEALLSKNALINWLNEITKKKTNIRLKNLDDLSNGLHFCLLLNIMTDGKFGLGKINQQAKLEHEKLQNLKQLIVGMANNNIDQKFDITKISRKNYQEILHMLQWFHKVMEKTNSGGPRSSRSAEKVVNFKVKAQADLKKPIKPRELKKDELIDSNPVTMSYFAQQRSNQLLPLPIHRQEEEPPNERVHSPLTDVCPELWRKTSIHSTPKTIEHISKGAQNQPITHEKSAHSEVGINQSSNEKQETTKFVKSYSEDLNLVKEEVIEPKFSNPEQKPASDRKFVTFHKSDAHEKSSIDPAKSKEERPASKQKSCLKSPAQTVKLSEEKKIQSMFSMNYEASNSERSALLTPRMI